MTEHTTTAVEKPPHPFRAAPWYDPSVQHRPCQCPRCRTPKGAGTWRQPVRATLAAISGVALPLISVVVNHYLRVVDLGPWGNAAVVLAAATALANLALSPCRRNPDTGQVRHHPPASTALRVALLVGALLGCAVWGYLALLFLPLSPLSVVALLWLGLGLCGLCPFFALALSVIQAVRGVRTLTPRLGRTAALALTLATLLAPPVALAGVGLHRQLQRQRVERQLDLISKQRPFSRARMAAVSALAGKEPYLVDAYLASRDRSRHRLLAEVYLRLTDGAINGSVVQARDARGRTVIHPWWFMRGGDSAWLLDFWRKW